MAQRDKTAESGSSSPDAKCLAPQVEQGLPTNLAMSFPRQHTLKMITNVSAAKITC